MRMRFAVILLLLALSGLVSPTLAQPIAQHASIEDRQLLAFSPYEITLSFSTPVRLQSISLTDIDGAVIALPAPRGAIGRRLHVIAFPVLPPQHYYFRWRGVGAGGAPVEGVVRFSLPGCEKPAPWTAR